MGKLMGKPRTDRAPSRGASEKPAPAPPPFRGRVRVRRGPARQTRSRADRFSWAYYAAQRGCARTRASPCRPAVASTVLHLARELVGVPAVVFNSTKPQRIRAPKSAAEPGLGRQEGVVVHHPTPIHPGI